MTLNGVGQCSLAFLLNCSISLLEEINYVLGSDHKEVATDGLELHDFLRAVECRQTFK
jgi:hypothetical protein